MGDVQSKEGIGATTTNFSAMNHFLSWIFDDDDDTKLATNI